MKKRILEGNNKWRQIRNIDEAVEQLEASEQKCKSVVLKYYYTIEIRWIWNSDVNRPLVHKEGDANDKFRCCTYTVAGDI